MPDPLNVKDIIDDAREQFIGIPVTQKQRNGEKRSAEDELTQRPHCAKLAVNGLRTCAIK